MSKRQLAEPLHTLEKQIIETLFASHHEWRKDLAYPESYSDMQGAVRGLLRMFEVKRLPIARELEYPVLAPDAEERSDTRRDDGARTDHGTPARAAVPEGWQTVPKEPTPAMIAICMTTGGEPYTGPSAAYLSECYRAMLEVAPAPEPSDEFSEFNARTIRGTFI